MRESWAKLRAALSPRRSPADDVAEEIEAHVRLAAEENLARGMSETEAWAAARRRFGNVMLTGELAREAWTFPRFGTFIQDSRYGLRGMRRSPGFSLTVILTLALGIGVTTAIFSVVDSVLLRPLPYPASERLVQLGESSLKGEDFSVTWVNYQYWRKNNRSFEDLAGFENVPLTLTGRGEPLLTIGGGVTSSYFGLVGARPVLGRLFSEADDRPGAAPVVLLTHQFWSGKLGADPTIVGSTLVLNGKPYQVTGVLAPHTPIRKVDYYLPLGLYRGATTERSAHGSMRLLGRLKPGVTLAAARADLDLIMQRLATEDPGPESDHRSYAEFLSNSMAGDVRPALLILLGAVGLVLAIACFNVAGLVLARSTARAREMAVRMAIGAGRSRLVRQLLTENMVIAVTGGLAGVLSARWCLPLLISLGPKGIPRLASTTLDTRVLVFAAGITILTGLLVGCAPLFAVSKLHLVTALNESSRSVTGAKRTQALRSALVVAEVALTLVLSFASGLLIRSLIAAKTADPGFAPDHLLALELILPSSAYKDDQAVTTFYDRLGAELRRLPGVTTASYVNSPPSGGDRGDWFYSVAGKPTPARGDVPIALINMAAPAYFRSMRIPLREGREFTGADRAGAPRVVIVNETFARKWWPGEPAAGHQIKIGGPYFEGSMCQIAGVAGSVSQMGLDTKPLPEIYFPFAQSASRAAVVMIRTSADPSSLIAAVRHTVTALDRNLPIVSLRPFETWLAEPLERRRFITLLLATFAALAMALAGVGIYGLLHYWVSVREDEIAIRLALGAQPPAIVRWVSAQASRLAAAGLVLGALAAWAVSRWLESLVFGVAAKDPMMVAAAAGAVLAISVLATLLPAWRAVRIDPAGKLHHS